jgi:DMSO/TMAO reductase YedYZ molybdopterin-dependent catalytic subunit
MKGWFAWLFALACAGAQAQAPRASLVTTQVAVGGEVRNELRLGVAELKALAEKTEVVRSRGYAGARLVDILASAEVREDQRQALRRTYVVATAADGFQAVFSWGELQYAPVGRGAIVAYERDGEPLRDGEGRIALVSLADERPGFRHVKWLARIDVRRSAEP